MTHAQNAAYDLALFESKKAKLVALKPNKKEQKVNHRRKKAQAILNVSAYALIALVVLAVIALLITSNAQLTELNSKIAESKAHLSELQSEQIRLESELAGKTSIANVNNFANNNGMTVAESNQICYISVDGADTVTVAARSGNWMAQIWLSVRNIFS